MVFAVTQERQEARIQLALISYDVCAWDLRDGGAIRMIREHDNQKVR
jgi:hypothetical protein